MKSPISKNKYDNGPPIKFEALEATNRYGEKIEMASFQCGDFKVEGKAEGGKQQLTFFNKGRKLIGFGGD